MAGGSSVRRSSGTNPNCYSATCFSRNDSGVHRSTADGGVIRVDVRTPNRSERTVGRTIESQILIQSPAPTYGTRIPCQQQSLRTDNQRCSVRLQKNKAPRKAAVLFALYSVTNLAIVKLFPWANSDRHLPAILCRYQAGVHGRTADGGVIRVDIRTPYAPDGTASRANEREVLIQVPAQVRCIRRPIDFLPVELLACFCRFSRHRMK